ncbi:hypothetical protein [Reyranella sp.]|jgi:hypothetical protein|uniref:hypothetical protein n=1 Tax=Reyranella sp. TaxID=1929291 RepID=UPI002F932CFE
MRAALFLVIGLVLLTGPALAGSPGDQGVTVLRGSSAPPPPPPAPSAEPTIVQREIFYAPYANYPAYLWPGVFGPGVVVTAPQRPVRPMVPTTTVPNGWPLIQTPLSQPPRH